MELDVRVLAGRLEVLDGVETAGMVSRWYTESVFGMGHSHVEEHGTSLLSEWHESSFLLWESTVLS